MKNLIILISIIGLGYSYSQIKPTHNTKGYDVALQKHVVGSWQHVQSTFPSGITETYDRQFNLYSDSLYIGLYFSNNREDTTFTHGIWYIRDTSVFLYTLIDTTYVLGDVVKVEHVDDSLLFLKKLWGFEQSRKTSMYKRISRLY